MGTRTPWGLSDSSEKLARGVVRYGTPSHGGFHLSKTRNVLVHEAWRAEDGWYEEDCEWAIVALTFPELFTEEERSHADASAKNWNPDGYSAATGKPVAPEESRVLRERALRAKHASDWVTVSAVGDWHESVPAGFVGVAAVLGGRPGLLDGREVRNFLIPAAEYGAEPAPIGFVVDPARHERVVDAKF